MKVVHIELGKYFYGGAKQVTLLMQGLKDFYNVDNILIATLGSVLANKMKDKGFNVIEIKNSGDHDLSLIWKINKILKKIKPSLVHIHSRRGADPFGGIAARLAKIPVIISRRVDNPESKFVTKLRYALYNHIIAISKGIENVLLTQGVNKNKLSCIHSGLDFVSFPKPEPNYLRHKYAMQEQEIVIGVVAQLIKRKGHHHLVNILPEIIKTYPNIKVFFFGQGKEEEYLKNRVNALNLQKHVIFAGFGSDMLHLYPGIDLIIHPALMEGLGISLIEAAYYGIPIIASNVGGIPEIINNKVCGSLLPPGDEVALKQEIMKFLKFHNSTKKKINSSIKERFDYKNMVSENYAVYKNLFV